jgi:hypothetical protein
LPPIVPLYVRCTIPPYCQPEIDATNETQKMCHSHNALPKGRGFENVVIVDLGAAATAGAAGRRQR